MFQTRLSRRLHLFDCPGAGRPTEHSCRVTNDLSLENFLFSKREINCHTIFRTEPLFLTNPRAEESGRTHTCVRRDKYRMCEQVEMFQAGDPTNEYNFTWPVQLPFVRRRVRL